MKLASPSQTLLLRLLVISLAFAWLAAGCSSLGSEFPSIAPQKPTAFVPPALAVSPESATSTATPTPEPARPTPEPPCTFQLTFLEDVTIPDGTVVAPGAGMDKRWRVQNSGTCNWDQSYQVRLIAGPDLSAPIEQALYPARSGTAAVIRIQFSAPREAGTYRSAWQAFNPAGEAFGDPFFIEVTVSP